MTQDVSRPTVESILAGITCEFLPAKGDDPSRLLLTLPDDSLELEQRRRAIKELHLIMIYKQGDRTIKGTQQWVCGYKIEECCNTVVIHLPKEWEAVIEAQFLVPGPQGMWTDAGLTDDGVVMRHTVTYRFRDTSGHATAS